MFNSVITSPVFWISIYLVGYAITIAVLSLPGALITVENRIPKALVRFFILFTFITSPVVLPFAKGPRMPIPTPVAVVIGIILLAANFMVKIRGQKRIGVIPALRSKGKLVTTGIYGVVRHPLYMSNGLLAIGMAVLLRSTYAMLFSVGYFLLFLPLIHFEEKDLLRKYGDEYREYVKKVPWRIIPKLV